MATYYNPSKRLSEWAASSLSPYIKWGNDGASGSGGNQESQKSSLSVGLWSGNVELSNVQLRPEAIEQWLNPTENSLANKSGTKIRWKLQRGTIDSIIIKIPWKSLIVGSSHCSHTAKNTHQANATAGVNAGKYSNQPSSNGKYNLNSVPEKGGCMAERQEGQDVQEQEEITSGFTTVKIEGIKLVLGYEIIHNDPQFEALQRPLSTDSADFSALDYSENEEEEDSTNEQSDLKSQIRQEKERIVQIAERRLLAGLDPFPDNLMSNLQSCVQRSMQSEIKIGAERKRRQFTASTAAQLQSSSGGLSPKSSPGEKMLSTNTLSGNTDTTNVSHVTNNQNESSDKNKTNDTPGPTSFLSRMENYVSSAISSLLWRVFDSLSLSVTCVEISLLGCSHYDKDIDTIQKSKEKRRKNKKKPEGEINKDHQLHAKERDKQKFSPEEDVRRHQQGRLLDSNHPLFLQYRSQSSNKVMRKGHRRVSSAYVRTPHHELSNIELGDEGDNHIMKKRADRRTPQPDGKSRGHRRVNSLDSVGRGPNTYHAFAASDRKKYDFVSLGTAGNFDGVEHDTKNTNRTHAKGSLESIFDDKCNFGFQEDPLIWAQEGQVEIGLTLDRFDVRPRSLLHGHWGGISSCSRGDDGTSTMDSGPSALKYFRFRRMGCFLRKHFFPTPGGGVMDGDQMEQEGELRTEKTLVWNNVNDSDFIVVPTDFEALCRLYRDRPEASSIVTTDCTSTATGFSNGGNSFSLKKGGGFDHASVSDSMAPSIDSHRTTSTKRRGKRDKKPRIETTVSEVSIHRTPLSHRTGSKRGLSASMLPVSFSSESNTDAITASKLNTTHPSIISSLPPHQSNADSKSSLKQRRKSILSSTSIAEESTTHGNKSTTMPARLCFHWKMGHIRSSLTSRHFFLIHSFVTSMERMKNGRPCISIRTALNRDRSLLERLAEDGQVIAAWEDHISCTFPSMRSEYSHQHQRMTSHRVVSLWWKYAILNVLRDMRRKKMLMNSCCEEGVSCKTRRINFGSSAVSYKYDWDWHSKIRKEYVDLYLVVNGHSASGISRVQSLDGNTSIAAKDIAAVAVAKLRIEQIEENLSVERIVLLKNVARALSIRLAEHDGTLGSSQPSPTDIHHFFSPNTHHKGSVNSGFNFAESSGNSTQVDLYCCWDECMAISPPKTQGSRAVHSQNSHYRWPSARCMSSTRTIPTSSTVESKKDDSDGYIMSDGTILSSDNLEHTRNQHETTHLSFSFYATLELSGISFALCDSCHANFADKYLGYEPAGDWQQNIPSDDVSALTGFSDADDSIANSQYCGRRIAAEDFDSMSRFWPSYYYGVCHEPIMIVHIVKVTSSIQSRSLKNSTLSVSEFSIGSVAVYEDSSLPSESNIFSIGKFPALESMRFGSSQEPIESNQTCGIIGGFTTSNGSSQIHNSLRPSIHASIGSTVANINWDWIETISEFFSVYKDTARRRLLPSIMNESLLEYRLLSCTEITSTRGPLFRFDLSDLSLKLPVDLFDGIVNHHMEATVNSLEISNIKGSSDISCNELDEVLEYSGRDTCDTTQYFPSHYMKKRLDTIYSSSSPFSLGDADSSEETFHDGLLVNIEGTNLVHVNERTSRTSTVLEKPVDVRIQFSNRGVVPGDKSDEWQTFPSVSIQTSPVIILVSERIIRANLALVHHISKLSRAYSFQPNETNPPPSLSIISQVLLLDIRLSAECFVFRISVKSEENDSTEDIDCYRLSQEKLRSIVTSFISQISCLDYNYPNPKSLDCMRKLAAERCQALGISRHESNDFIAATYEFYRKEASSLFGSAQDQTKSPKYARNNNRPIKSNARSPCPRSNHLNPEYISGKMEDILLKTVEKSMVRSQRLTKKEVLDSFNFDLAIEAKHVSIQKSFYYNGHSTRIKSNFFAVQNGSGNHLMTVSQGTSAPDYYGQISTKTKTSNKITNTAFSLSLQSRLSSHHFLFEPDIYIEGGNMSLNFHPEAIVDVLNTYESTKNLFVDAVPKVGGENCSGVRSVHHNISVNGIISSMTVLFTDKCVPFCRCSFSDVAIEKSIRTTFLSNSISLDCLSPIGSQTYPDIISTHDSSPGDGFNLHSAVTIDLSSQVVSVNLNGVKLLLLRQFINDFIQYINSPSYGIGLVSQSLKLLRNTHHKAGNHSKKFTFDLTINNSSVVLPRDSCSIDLVGIEFENISIKQELIIDTWKIEDFFAKTSNASEYYDTDDNYFDCNDIQQCSSQTQPFRPDGTTNNSELVSLVPRLSLSIKNARIFSALNRRRHSGCSIRMALWNNHAYLTQAKKDAYVFKAIGNPEPAIVEEIESRFWEEITSKPLSLKITVDWAPHLRLLLENGERNSHCLVSFDLRMSQLYLLMSIWYSNMQELPLMFPYENEFIEPFFTIPEPAVDWPEYGTDDFVNRIKFRTTKRTFELGLCFEDLRVECKHDVPGYFSEDPPSMPIIQRMFDKVGISSISDCSVNMSLKNIVCHIVNDEDALLRVGLAATEINVRSGQTENTIFTQHISVRSDNNRKHKFNLAPFPDVNWGLDCGRHTIVDGLPQPFQISVIMTPDMNCMINVGADMLEAGLVDLSMVWILLDYFGLYFKQGAFGHPAFLLDRMVEKANSIEAKKLDESDNDCLNIDFRLWLTNPHIVIPSNPFKTNDTCIMLEALTGLHYRYRSFGSDYSSQSIVTKDLGIVALREYIRPMNSRGMRQVSGSFANCGVKTLIDGLSFSIKYNYDARTNYVRFAARIPLSSHHFDRRDMQGIESSEIEMKPFVVEPPLVCKPFDAPTRFLGYHETSIYYSYDHLKLASNLLMNFVGPRIEANEPDRPATSGNLFSITACVERVKLVVSDPVMGMHRPLICACFPSLLLTASQLKDVTSGIDGKDATLNERPDCGNDFQASLEATLFIDYFKLGLTRSWEPFVEPFKFLILYEKSKSRGKGITFHADCPLHMNLTGSMIETLDDSIETLTSFWMQATGENVDPFSNSMLARNHNAHEELGTSTAVDQSGRSFTFSHISAELIEDNERIAYSFKNVTGQKVRVHAHSNIQFDKINSKTVLSYLDHLSLMPLSFPATYSVIKNLESVEVPFECDHRVTAQASKGIKAAVQQLVDVQVPGFQWVRGISMEKIGKHFVELIPRSLSLQAKVNGDWRLKNALHVLTEVNSVNGGRRMTVSSIFELVNKTDHPLFLALNPDPRHFPKHNCFEDDSMHPLSLDSEGDTDPVLCVEDDSAYVKLDSDNVFSIPYLLLESALRLKGNHLGSIWIRPDQDSSSIDHPLFGLGSSRVGYPSRPIQLAKVLHESSIIFKHNDTLLSNATTSVEVSCPIYSGVDNEKKSTPFCYVVEVKRSPLVKTTQSEKPKINGDTAGVLSPSKMGKGIKNARNKVSKATESEKADIHAPVTYSLTIHPPIIIENLLPERGRFELMNAVTQSVLWWSNLEPGERVPVHTVGLDAPLLLLLNLGFCRTPVGEGALVHHGGGAGILRAGLNSIENAVRNSKDKVRKTLYTMTESKGTRGASRVAQLRPGKSRQPGAARKAAQLGSNIESEAMDNLMGGMTSMWRDVFGQDDVALETTVVDSIGQRLTLHIDNVQGSGGQRHIKLFVPFWIVNTTEHSLRYKQENAQSFVSGTVSSLQRNGSKPVDGSNRNDVEDVKNASEPFLTNEGLQSMQLDTIFSGTPGVLTRLKSQGKLDPPMLACLISEDLPLNVVSKLAFMFNFQDVFSLGGPPRLCMQLFDSANNSPYTSSWSSGFGLESVGVTQIVGMHCKDGRSLEVSVSISVAPGRLSNYTKIVRICPRYVVVNQLSQPIRLWQDNSILHPNLAIDDSNDVNENKDSRKWVVNRAEQESSGDLNQYKSLFGITTNIASPEDSGMDSKTTANSAACFIATIQPSGIISFHLPDTRADRLLRIDLGSDWNLSCSFNADMTAEYVLEISRARDIRMLPTLSTRAAPIYTVVLPPQDVEWNGELGVWFETDWGRERSIIVKGTKEGSFASFHTDIVVGDELLFIDDKSVNDLSFDEAMKYLKARLESVGEIRYNQAIKPLQRMRKTIRGTQYVDNISSSSGILSLTLMTLEERLRRLRRSAVVGHSYAKNEGPKGIIEGALNASTTHHSSETQKNLLVDMKFLFQSMFIFVRAPTPSSPPHKIINRSLRWNIFYRQRGCDNHPFKCLCPGESSPFTWQEPTKPKKLTIRVGAGEWIESGLGKKRNNCNFNRARTNDRKRTQKPMFSFQFIENEEQGNFGPTKTVKLEEIGFSDKLPCPSTNESGENENCLHCHVDTEGSTRVLVISDEATETHTDDETLIRRHLSNIRKDLWEEERRRSTLEEMKKFLRSTSDEANSSIPQSDEIWSHQTSIYLTSEQNKSRCNKCSCSSDIDAKHTSHTCRDVNTIEDDLQHIVDYDEGLFITKRNQVIVEVLEATGLKSSDLNGLSNPYCKVSLVQGKKKKHPSSFASKISRRSYKVEKTLSPQWSRQAFVFDVPEKASYDPRETRRLSILCVVKSSEKFGKDKFLGQAHIHLRNLKDQKEDVGWFPLMGKLGQRDIGRDSVDRVRGSIRLRVHWVHDLAGLIEYNCLWSDRRLETLRRTKIGMKRQLANLQKIAKEKQECAEFSFVGVPALATMYKKRKSAPFEQENTSKVKEERAAAQPLRIQGARAVEQRWIRSVAAARRVVPRIKVLRSKSLSASDNLLLSGVDAADEYSESDDEDFISASFTSDESDYQYSSPEFDPPRVDSNMLSRNRSRTFSDSNIPFDPVCELQGIGIPFVDRAPSGGCSSHLLYIRDLCWRNQIQDIFSLTTRLSPTTWTAIHAIANSSKSSSRRRIRTLSTGDIIDDSKGGTHSVVNFLRLPPSVPLVMAETESMHLMDLLHSRSSFSKACSRSLGSVVNPGGVLTIRPITALNLPESYTGMFVKVRCGGYVCLSETVDSKVAPVWNNEEINPSEEGPRAERKKYRHHVNVRQNSSQSQGDLDFNDIAEMVNPSWAWGRPRRNDLCIQVDPFETSKSLRLSVIGEKLQSKVELGVLEFPLGPALECCAQSLEDYEADMKSPLPQGLSPAYIRWFPLLSPSEAIPIEGDMGQRIHPKESEKRRDDAFKEYFAPCIKLALLFQRDEIDRDDPHADSANSLNTNQYIYARMYRISAALIDSSRALELLSLTSRDADIKVSVTKAKTRVAAAIGHVQLDQQSIISSRAPVVLAPTPVKYMQPSLQFLCWKNNIRSKIDIDSYEYVALQVQEMDLKIEEAWLFDLWEFMMDITKKREARTRLRHKENLNTPLYQHAFGVTDEMKDPLSAAAAFLDGACDSKVAKRIYIGELILGYMKFNLSYFKSTKISSSQDAPDDMLIDIESLESYVSPILLASRYPAVQSGDDAFSKWSENLDISANDEGHHVNINIISTVFPSISEAPIKFSGKMLEHIFEMEGDVWRSLQSYYAAEALKQIYKLVGSLDFVGNPTMVLSSFATGLRDFFLQPSQELKNIRTNPSRFGVGILKGTLSLFSNSASGVFGFASHLGATFGHTAAVLTLDEHFRSLHAEQKAAQQRQYDRWKKKGFGHVSLMVTRPVHDIVFGVLSAGTGLLTEPYRGAKRNGPIGFAQGSIVGVIGVVVKPIVGLSDAFTHVFESFHDIAKSVNLLETKFKPVERHRFPYVFGVKKILLPFNQVDSRSAQLLLSHPVSKKARKGDETIVVSESLQMGHGREQFVIVTTKRVVLFKVKPVDSQGFVTATLVWQVRFEKGVRISSTLGSRGHNSFIICVTRKDENVWEDANNEDDVLSSCQKKDRVDGSVNCCGNKVEKSFNSYHDEGRAISSSDITKNAVKVRAWPFGPSDGFGRVTRFIAEGDFYQRSQLSRIHNAICCMSGDFDSIDNEGVTGIGKVEGITTFGSLVFDRRKESAEPTSLTAQKDFDALYSCLEQTSWMCDKEIHHDGVWFSKTIKTAYYEGGPSWLTDAKARGMSTSLSSVPTPTSPSPGIAKPVQSVVPESKHEKSGRIANEISFYPQTDFVLNTVNDEESCSKHNLLEGDVDDRSTLSSKKKLSVSSGMSSLSFKIPSFFKQTSPCNSICSPTDFVTPRESTDAVASELIDADLKSPPERTNDATEKDPSKAGERAVEEDSSRDKYYVGNSKVTLKTAEFGEQLTDPSMNSSHMSNLGFDQYQRERFKSRDELTLDERVRRVEAMLEQLVSRKSLGEVTSKAIPVAGTIDGIEGRTVRTLPLQENYPVTTMASPLRVDCQRSDDGNEKSSSSSNNNIDNNTDPQVEALLREIAELKEKLAAKNSVEGKQTSDLQGTAASSSSESKVRHGLKGRLKNVFSGKNHN